MYFITSQKKISTTGSENAMSRKNLKGIVKKIKSPEDLPDFLSCLFRRRRNWAMFAIDNNISDAESLEAFLTENATKFSFSDEFFELVQPLAAKKKEKKKKTDKKEDESDAPSLSSVAEPESVAQPASSVSELFFVASDPEDQASMPDHDGLADDGDETNSSEEPRKKNKKKKS